MIRSIPPHEYMILIVDDDPYITELIQLYLKDKGFNTLCCSAGDQALQVMQKQTIHLAVLDVMLPHLNGWDVLRKVRETSDMPVLMLTAKGESEDKIQGFGLGADDYIVKPFDPNELVVRIQSLLRRAYMQARQLTQPSVLHYGNLKVDTTAHTVNIDNEHIELTPREYKLLLTFIQHPNQVLDRQQLLDHVWGDDYFGEDRVVDVFVKRLRHKLTGESAHWSIETVRGAGYKFRVEG
jgi:DNA-binding response OmpR family regulator